MNFLSNYHFPYSILGLNEKVEKLTQEAKKNETAEVYKKIFSFIDLTTLNSTDSKRKVENMCRQVNEFKSKFKGMPDVAAICVYPNFVSTVKQTLKTQSIGIASVAAGFPSSQTFLDIKNLESKMAVEAGATDVDIVISLGAFLSGNHQFVFDEIVSIKKATGKAHLKVILETGALTDTFKIWEASLIAMEAGADFIKTSTGKMQPAATIEAAVVMCEAIKQFHEQTGRKVGFKPAGGISSSDVAAIYYTVVEKMLGEEWLNSKLFRIGASSLANKLLSDIHKFVTGNEQDVNYF
ncbi:MAG: deoxyribose-phosphate aldolase [Chloroflexia bacterium]|nr:deoxyribose-phosphate aldolase [Chloroflexia bacterium]